MRRFPGISRIIMRSLIGKPATLMYPKRKRTYTAATRGWVENDIKRCIFCRLCERNCPTTAIEASKERKDWQIDSLRCCLCRRCVEVCPVSARIFGDRNDKQSLISQFIQNHRVQVLRPETGNAPNVFYVGIDKDVS